MRSASTRLRRAIILLLLCSAVAAPRRAIADASADWYWVLGLIWMPEYCATRRAEPCERTRGMAVSGLWRQTDSGPAAPCTEGAALPASPAADPAAPMRESAEAQPQRREQGACSGSEAAADAERVSRAAQSIHVPDDFLRGRSNQRISKSFLEKAFLEANPRLAAEALTIECRSHYLTEVRVCMDRELRPRACGTEVGDICERELIIRPPG